MDEPLYVDVRAETLIDSTEMINLHVINDRLYVVRSKSVSIAQRVLYVPSFPIVASCITGETIALLTTTQLVVLHPRSLVEVGHCETFALGLGPQTSKRQITASFTGPFIALNPLPKTLAIYKFEDLKLEFLRTVMVPIKLSRFCVTGSTVPYVWHLYVADHDSYNVSVYEASKLSPRTYPDTPIGIFPVRRSTSSVGHKDTNRFICPFANAKGPRSEGVLCYVERRLYYMSLNNVIIGNLFSGLVEVPGGERSIAVCVERCNNNSNLSFYHSNGSVAFLRGGPENWRYEVLPNPDVGKANKCDWTHTEPHIVAIYKSKRDQTRFKVEAYGVNMGGIMDLAINTHKLPHKIVALVGSTLHLHIPKSVHVDNRLEGPELDANDVEKVLFVESLRMLVLSRSLSKKTWCHTGGTQFSCDISDLVAAGTIKQHTLAIVGGRQIKLFSTLAPYREISNISTGINEVILHAAFCTSGILIASANSVSCVSIEPGFPVVSLVDNLPISFIAAEPSNGKLSIGVSLVSPSIRHVVENLARNNDVTLDRSFLTATSTNWPSELSSSRPEGAILTYQDQEVPSLLSVALHAYVPTAYHESASNATVIYGSEGIVLNKTTDKEKAASFHESKYEGSLRWAGNVADNMVLIGSELLVYTPNQGLLQLVSPSKLQKSSPIGTAAVISNQGIAYTTKKRLEFASALSIAGPPAPDPLLSKEVHAHKRGDPPLKLLMIPSQRLVMVYGRRTCALYDTSTLKMVQTSGSAAMQSEIVGLWKFAQGGNVHEHLVALDDQGYLDSLTFKRVGNKIDFEHKYRVHIFALANDQYGVPPQRICCRSNSICMSRGSILAILQPRRKPSALQYIGLGDTIRCIDYAGDHWVITTTQYIHVLKADEPEVLGKFWVGEPTVHDLSMEEELCENEIFKTLKMEVVSHVSSLVANETSAYLFVLCAMKEPTKELQSLLLNVFDFHSGKFIYSEMDDRKVRFIRPDPQQNHAEPASELRVYASTPRHSVVRITFDFRNLRYKESTPNF